MSDKYIFELAEFFLLIVVKNKQQGISLLLKTKLAPATDRSKK